MLASTAVVRMARLVALLLLLAGAVRAETPDFGVARDAAAADLAPAIDAAAFDAAVMTGDLRVDSITPSEIAEGASVDAIVFGRGFAPGASVAVRSGGRDFAGVSPEPDRGAAIRFRLPPKLARGLYDVVVKLPDGREAKLEGALKVGGVRGIAGCSVGRRRAGWPLGVALFALLPLRRRRRRRG